MYNEQELLNRIRQLENELKETKDHLKKYTSPNRYKNYYEKHREKILEKHKNLPTTDKEKRKETNKRAYLKRKSVSDNTEKKEHV